MAQQLTEERLREAREAIEIIAPGFLDWWAEAVKQSKVYRDDHKEFSAETPSQERGQGG